MAVKQEVLSKNSTYMKVLSSIIIVISIIISFIGVFLSLSFSILYPLFLCLLALGGIIFGLILWKKSA